MVEKLIETWFFENTIPVLRIRIHVARLRLFISGFQHFTKFVKKEWWLVRLFRLFEKFLTFEKIWKYSWAFFEPLNKCQFFLPSEKKCQ